MAVTLVKEDGTGLSNANSYEDLAGAAAYFEGRTVAAWTAATDDQKKRALIVGTTLLEGRYRHRWPGDALDVNTPQALSWPRSRAWDEEDRALTGVPAAVRAATCELAAEQLRAPQTAAIERPLSSVSLGGAIDISWESGSGGSQRAMLPYVAELLTPIVGPVGRLVRA